MHCVRYKSLVTEFSVIECSSKVFSKGQSNTNNKTLKFFLYSGKLLFQSISQITSFSFIALETRTESNSIHDREQHMQIQINANAQKIDNITQCYLLLVNANVSTKQCWYTLK